MRVSNATERFINFIEAAKLYQGLSYDEVDVQKIDCARLANQAVEALTGIDFLHEYDLEYSNKKELIKKAAYCKKELGCNFWEFPDLFAERVFPIFHQAGDIAIFTDSADPEIESYVFGVIIAHDTALVVLPDSMGYKNVLVDELHAVFRV